MNAVIAILALVGGVTILALLVVLALYLSDWDAEIEIEERNDD
jgi:hypothetical protein